jgi:ubiquinone/menaquinone biosynthesis C-methylase UbiE
MNEHDQYKTDFMRIFEKLEYWGPGCEADTIRALSYMPVQPKSILEIGCGNGVATIVLAENSSATITAVDIEQSALNRLVDRLEATGLSGRATPLCVSMIELPFDGASFDLIWAEASAYVMGVNNALTRWKPLLEVGGILVISDMVWLTDTPSEEVAKYFEKEYPDIQSVNTRVSQMKAAGYEVLQHFTLSQDAWQNYYDPLKARVEALTESMKESAALKDIKKEIDICTNHLGEYGYQMFILKRA